MKRRLLSAFLAVMMVLTMAPVAFAADGNGTAENALPSTIEQDTTLNDNYTADITVPAGKTVMLDLDGHTLTNTGRGKATLSVAGNATVKNGTIIGGTGYYNIEVEKGGSLTLENVTATAGNTGSSMIDNWGTLTITSGTYTGGLNVVKSEPKANLTISGGSFELQSAVANGYTAVVLNYGNATISEGTFLQSATTPNWAYPQVVMNGQDGDLAPNATVTGGMFTNRHSRGDIFRGYGNATSASFQVSDGTFNKNVKSSFLAEGKVCKKNTTTGMYELTTGATGVTLSESEKTIKVGERFKLEATLTPEDAELKSVTWEESSDETIATVNNGTVKGIAIGDVTITATPNAAGATPATCTVHVYDEAAQIGERIYPTLEQAIAAVQTGETIKLLKNIQVSKTIAVNKDCSIDLNDHTLTGKTGTYGSRVFNISGKLTLTGKGEITTAKKNGSALQATSSVVNVAEGGNLIVNKDVTITASVSHAVSVVGTADFNGTITATKANCYAVTSTGIATIKEGYYNGSFDGTNGTITISGGYFTLDPTAYCVTGKTGVSSGDSTYPWTVGRKGTNEAAVVSGEPVISAPKVSYDEGSAEKTLLDGAQTALETGTTTVSGNGVNAAAKSVANDNAVTADTAVVAKLNEAIGNGTVGADDTHIVIQTYLDMKIVGVSATDEQKTISVDIQPMYRTVATTADVANNPSAEIVLKAEDGKTVNAVPIGDAKPLEVNSAVTVVVPVPEGFANSSIGLVVKHEKDNQLVGYHKGTYSSSRKTVTFTNDKGFSTFTVMYDKRSTKIQYVDKDGHNIGSAKSYSPSNVNDTLPTTAAESGYVFNGWKFEGIDGVYTTLTDELLTKLAAKGGKVSATPDFSKRSSGSSGKTTYKVTTSAVNNGGVNASPSNAEKGATITITLSPDKGYKLDKLTVTDGSGKTVSTVKKSDTVYTFTMPASAVKVGVSYVKATETPSETKFNDVSANDWFASAVDYVTGKGMMNGTADNTFSPKANTTRGMVVTVLYRLENQPSTSAASFTDVASGAYYANAVAWANANGIVSGYGSGKFGPNDKVTREQLAAILYRYAQYKKYDVSVGEDTNILSYNDAQSISSYAIPAIQWACGAGVVTGKSGSKLDPKGNATRAEVAAMLMRFCENVK